MRIAALMALLFLQGSPGAATDRGTYQVTGRILQADGNAFPGSNPVVFLVGAITLFNRQVQAGRDGKFKFKNIPAGTYMLIAAVPRVGEFKKTIEVSQPSETGLPTAWARAAASVTRRPAEFFYPTPSTGECGRTGRCAQHFGSVRH